MSSRLDLATLTELRTAPAEPPVFSVPARHNPRLQALVERINADEELRQLWRCANVNAVDRLGIGDHGEVHVRIVANAALRLLRLLREAGDVPNLVADHRLTPEDAEVVVVLAAALHDLGLSVQPERNSAYAMAMAQRKANELLDRLYTLRERTIVISEILHATVAHHGGARALTLEAGVLTAADSLDLSSGRTHIPVTYGGDGIQAISAAAIDAVSIRRGERCPVRVEIFVRGPDGLDPLLDLLRRKLKDSPLAGRLELVARLGSSTAGRWVPLDVWV